MTLECRLGVGCATLFKGETMKQRIECRPIELDGAERI
jgi:hypothetical protein